MLMQCNLGRTLSLIQSRGKINKGKELHKQLWQKFNYGDQEVHPILTSFNSFHIKVFKLSNRDLRLIVKQKMGWEILLLRSSQSK